MRVTFDDGTELRIGAPVLTKISLYIERNGDGREAGGVLIGTQSIDGMSYEVTDVTLPGVCDKRRRFLFVRGKSSANRLIRQVWRQSAGKKNYLGEWHTHDEQQPRPSGLDRQTVRHLAKDSSAPFGRVFLVIFGNSDRVFAGMTDLQEGAELTEGEYVSCRE